MDSTYRCVCDRLWILGTHPPDAARTGRLVCRCGNALQEDSDGTWHARLVEPVESFGPLRRSAFAVGLIVLRMANKLSVPLALDSWLRPHNLAKLRSPNRALHVHFRPSIRQPR